jgi:hypothetical protein
MNFQPHMSNRAAWDVLPELRDLFSRHPKAVTFGAEALAALLYGPRPASFEEVSDIESALEALKIEGEVIP